LAKLTIADLFQAKKEGRKLTHVFTMDVNEAAAAEAAGVHIITAPKFCFAEIRAAAPNTFMCAGNVNDPEAADPYGAIRFGFEMQNLGADCVYTSVGLDLVEAMAKEYIPVIGHVGYVPYRDSWFGGARAIGKTGQEAAAVYHRAKQYQDAGALGVEIEIVPAKVTEEIAKRLDILLLSMGAGAEGDAQYLFSCDVLGTNTGHIPRHAKVYADLAAEEKKLHEMRVKAYKALCDDISSGAYPTPKQLIGIKDEEFAKFVEALD